ncbi:unnamed protein product [Tuber aestivum]|uniref:BTB domain-containing protein n=1 Tax=Tuber aestivum TaxID=59557 RepID=A0A292PKI8_9PEZI|nr:unnamed protein product [Tuber aestivum]
MLDETLGDFCADTEDGKVTILSRFYPTNSDESDNGGSPSGKSSGVPTAEPQYESKFVAEVTVAPEGDLVLEVPSKNGLARLKVSSQVMCLVSPVFRAMLGPSSMFKEACELRASTSGYTLQLEGDDPEAFVAILHVLHCQTDKVPSAVSFEDLFHMAIVCDKYDCALAVAAWVDIWAEGWRDLAFDAAYSEWMFISWAFLLPSIFEPLSRRIVMEGRYDDELGQLLWGERSLDEIMVPDPVVSAILQVRSDAIKAILDDTESYLDLYSNPERTMCLYQIPECDVMILGSFVREFRKRGIHKREKFLLMSLNEVVASIKEISIYFYSETFFHGDTCSFLPALFAKVDKICEGIEGLKLERFSKGVVWRRYKSVFEGKLESLEYKPVQPGAVRGMSTENREHI